MFVYDLIDPQELVGFIRSLQFPQFTLDQILPDRPLADIEFRFTRAQLLDEDAAMYRAFDAEAPIGKRQGTSRVTGTIPPLSKKIRLNEEERLRLNSLVSGDQGPIIAQIFDDAANMTRALQARIELARGQALATAGVTISENGVSGSVAFGIPGTHVVTPATLWSNTAASTPVDDIRSWVDVYVATNGELPGSILTSTAVVSNLLRNAQFRQLAVAVTGAPNLVTFATVQAVLQAFGLPPIAVYDTVVRVDGVATRVTPSNKAIMLPSAGAPLGATFYGVTAEALELQAAGQIVSTQAPGLVAVIDKTFDPVSTWTKAAGLALPIIANPRFLFIATVQ